MADYLDVLSLASNGLVDDPLYAPTLGEFFVATNWLPKTNLTLSAEALEIRLASPQIKIELQTDEIKILLT